MSTRNTTRAEERILWGGKPRRAATTHQTPETMKAITTKYFGPTYSRGSRIKAYAEGVSTHTMSYDSSSRNVHRMAAQELADRMGWKDSLVQGGLPDGCKHHQVFVFVPDEMTANLTPEMRHCWLED